MINSANPEPAPNTSTAGSLETYPNFKVTLLGKFSQGMKPVSPSSAPEPVSNLNDTIFRMYTTPTALCFGRIGEAFSAEDQGVQYDGLHPLSADFLECHPQNFHLPIQTIQRLLLDRRPHLHNPVNGGSLHFWVNSAPAASTALPLEYTFLLDYTTDADQLLDVLKRTAQAAGAPLPQVQEDPALQIIAHPADADGSILLIQLQWQRGMGLVLLLFALCWSGLITYLILLLSLTFNARPNFGGGAAIGSLLPFLLMGIFLIYYALTHLFNTTRLTLSGRTLHIFSRPLPWISNKRMLSMPPGADIHIQTRYLEQWNEYPTITTCVYDLVVSAPDSPPQRLISLSRLPHALRVRAALRAALRAQPEPES